MCGGVSSSSYWPLFSFLRPQDVFSKGFVHLPRKGRLRFPCTESRISGIFMSNYKVCLYVCAPPKNAHMTTCAAGFGFI